MAKVVYARTLSCLRCALRVQAPRRVTQRIDGLRHCTKVVRTLARQRYLLVPAMQQSNAEKFLERADLAADRARRDVQLVSRERDAHVPRSGLEGAHGIQWGEAIHADVRLALEVRNQNTRSTRPCSGPSRNTSPLG